MEFKKTILNLTNCKCSQKQQLLFELSIPLEQKFIQAFSSHNFVENKVYTKTGLFYMEDNNLIAIGPIGANRLQIKCKTITCEQSIANLENILRAL